MQKLVRRWIKNSIKDKFYVQAFLFKKDMSKTSCYTLDRYCHLGIYTTWLFDDVTTHSSLFSGIFCSKTWEMVRKMIPLNMGLRRSLFLSLTLLAIANIQTQGNVANLFGFQRQNCLVDCLKFNASFIICYFWGAILNFACVIIVVSEAEFLVVCNPSMNELWVT